MPAALTAESYQLPLLDTFHNRSTVPFGASKTLRGPCLRQALATTLAAVGAATGLRNFVRRAPPPR
jgi:hypothetical protein